jgi:uncharacterized protein YbjT (DUF2867 family)
MRMARVTAVTLAVMLCVTAPGLVWAETSRGLGLAPSLPSLQPVTSSDMASGLFSKRASKSNGVPLGTPLAVADALSNAKCVALLNYVSGWGTGSINQRVDVNRFIMNCR